MKWVVVKESYRPGASKTHFIVDAENPKEAMKKAIEFAGEIIYYKFSVYDVSELR